MALKDWNKVGINYWKRYHPTELELKIFRNMSTGIWNVTVKKFFSNYYFVDKKFKTKTQALRYAKSYMRTH